MNDIYIDSIDDFLAFFDVKYDPGLPKPTSSLHSHVRTIWPKLSAMAVQSDDFPTDETYKKEHFGADRIVFNGKQLLVWRKM